MRFIQRLIRGRGLTSEIYVMDRPEAMQDVARLYETLDPRATDLLLIHHGGGNPATRWLKQLPCAKVLVYHNITPERFFPPYDPLRQTLKYGREQLVDWKRAIDGAIAVSGRNYAELMEAGYSAEKTAIIPLLVDLERFKPARDTVDAGHNDPARLLFVGRLAPHKNQHGLVAMLAELVHMTNRSVHLTLVGEGDQSMATGLRDLATHLGVSDRVEITGKVSDECLSALYSQADLYVSMSEHEGFGMPLVEAMIHEVPIVAYAAPESSLVETVAGGGLVLDTPDLAVVAATAATLLENAPLRAQLIKAQRQRLDELRSDCLDQRFADFLQTLGFVLNPDTTGPA